MPISNPADVAGPIAIHAAIANVHHVPPTPANVKTGTYTGNNGDNRAIPHNLGVTPKAVLIICTGDTHVGTIGNTKAVNLRYDVEATVTGWTSTNFYVSKTAINLNNTGLSYNFVAFG